MRDIGGSPLIGSARSAEAAPAENAPQESGSQFQIDFGVNGNSVAFTQRGWSVPEDSETWAEGESSLLVIPAPVKPATHIMMLTLRPHILAGRLGEQRLKILVNGIEVAQFSLAKRSIRACRVPWRVLAGRQSAEVTFEMPDSARPSDIGASPDRRRLGIAFSSIRLFADGQTSLEVTTYTGQTARVQVNMDAIIAADRISVSELMLKFESLGQNCEFGLIQRACQAEPLGLLRFSSTPLHKLLAAIEADFEGMGQPDALQVQLSSNGRELMINDKRFGFLYHAFVEAGAMDEQALHQREVRRVPFLIRKLLQDFAAAEKIFVFKGMGAMDEEEVFPLAMALRRYGPNTLLFVNLADARHPPGSVEARAPGFLVGYMSRFAPTEAAGDFDLAQWVRVCRAAYRLRQAGAPQL